MNNQTDWKLLLRHLSGETTIEDAEQIEAWLASDPQNEKLMALLQTAWDSPEKDVKPSNLEAAWERVSTKAGITIPLEEIPAQVLRMPIADSHGEDRVSATYRHHRISVYQMLRYAAVVVFILSLPLIYIILSQSPASQAQSVEMEKLVVEYGKQAQLSLSDGTIVKLDAGSELVYPKEFSGNTREVHLIGEGYFEVAHNPEKPFIVHANGAKIRVLGTRFNVSAWSLLQRVEVAVSEGKVSFRAENKTEGMGIVIPRGRMSVMRTDGVPMKPFRVDIEKQTAWQDRELILENTPLYEALDQLSRWYGVEVILPDPIYRSVKITGTFKNKSVEHIFEAIGLMINLEFERNGKQIIFHQPQ